MDVIERMESKSTRRDRKKQGIKMPVHNRNMQELVANSIKKQLAKQESRAAKQRKYLTTAA